jgi:phosphoglucosamine mutase
MEEYAMAKYFGTDGFRGEANIGLTVEHAFKIGRYLGWYYGRDHKAKAVIGKDTRRSSYMFEYALCAGLTASGADAYMMHVTTTPSVSYIARADDFDCGIMISASHNPYYDNGIKLLNADGEKMEESVLDGIEEYIDSESELPYAQREAIGRTIDYSAGRNRYIGYLISLATRSYKGRRIGLDCANGSTWQMAKSIFDALGADTYVIANSPDGLNINVDCGSTHIGNLRKFVLENRLDAGFAFDGDADRCLAVDEKGNVVTGDHILYVCAKYMKDRGVFGDSKVVTTVMSNMGLYKALDEIGIGYEKTAVGDKYVAENMRANGYLIGGEQSGHIIFGRSGQHRRRAADGHQAYGGHDRDQAAALRARLARDHLSPSFSKRGGHRQGRDHGVRRGEKRGGEGRAGTGRQRQGASAQKRHRARPAGHGGGLQRRAVRKIRGLYHRRHARRRQTCEGEMTCTEQKTCWI